jgi:lipoyl(octanoyl) transferase
LSYRVEYKNIGVKDYKETWDYQETLFSELLSAKREGIDHNGYLIFVEHPHVYTLGKSGTENNLLISSLQLRARGASFYRIDRGGDITYHGPGQIVGYPIFDLEKAGKGLREYIEGLEEAVIRTVGEYGIVAGRLQGGTGVWLDPEKDSAARKICAIGVRASRYVTMHGLALNINTDLGWFRNINPCGFTDKGVTSLAKELGAEQDMDAVRECLKKNLSDVFDLEWINR